MSSSIRVPSQASNKASEDQGRDGSADEGIEFLILNTKRGISFDLHLHLRSLSLAFSRLSQDAQLFPSKDLFFASKEGDQKAGAAGSRSSGEKAELVYGIFKKGKKGRNEWTDERGRSESNKSFHSSKDFELERWDWIHSPVSYTKGNPLYSLTR